MVSWPQTTPKIKPPTLLTWGHEFDFQCGILIFLLAQSWWLYVWAPGTVTEDVISGSQPGVCKGCIFTAARSAPHYPTQSPPKHLCCIVTVTTKGRKEEGGKKLRSNCGGKKLRSNCRQKHSTGAGRRLFHPELKNRAQNPS